MHRLLDRYIFTELLPPFSISLGALCFVMLTKEMLRLVELLVSQGVGLGAVLKVIVYLLPSFLVLTLPIAGIIASISAFSRLSYDREVIALRAAGVSLFRLSLPVLVFSSLVFGVTLALSQWGQPWSNISLKRLALSVLRDQLTLSLEKGVFNEPFPKMVVYVERTADGEGTETGIFISDERKPEKAMLILASDYQILNDPANNRVLLRLLDGSVHTRTPEIDEYRQSWFSVYNLPIPLDPLLYMPATKRPSRETILARLEQSNWKDVDALRRLMESYKDLSFPTAALLLGMLGVPVGIVYRRTGRAGGFAVGLVIIVGYYLLNVLCDFLVMKHVLWPSAGAWIPNVIILAVVLWLFHRVGRH